MLQFLHCEAKKQVVLVMNREPMLSWQHTSVSVSLSLCFSLSLVTLLVDKLPFCKITGRQLRRPVKYQMAIHAFDSDSQF